MLKKLNDFVLYNIATGFGSGLSPIAPGTVGTLAAMVFVFFFYPGAWLYQLLFVIITTAIAIYAAGWLAEAEGEKDPSIVVADEFVGLFASFLFITPDQMSLKIMIAAFFIFRAFDIWKPWLIGRAENLPGGYGIVLDDTLSGLCTCACLHLLIGFVFT